MDDFTNDVTQTLWIKAKERNISATNPMATYEFMRVLYTNHNDAGKFDKSLI